jgi:hypothetical protein
MCDLENIVNEEAIAREWAAAPSEQKKYIYIHIYNEISKRKAK